MKFRGRSVGGYFAGIAVLGVLAYGGVAGFFYLGQERLIFRPTTLPASYQFALPETKEVSVPVEGGTLSALHFKQPDAKGVIFFLHGNGGNLSSWLRTTDFYRNNKFDVFMIDYRGYGKSAGSIDSEAQLHADVRAAWNWIAPQYADKKRVIFGRSLGTTLAAKLSSDVASDWTFLVSPFYNLNAMREAHYAWLPAALMRYTFTTDQWLPRAKSSITILHGDVDELISYSQAERLRALVPSTELIEIKGGTHTNLHHLPSYIDALSQRLAKL
jgi:alpha-beta hydrolase superfamily lysophospholipase